MRLSLFRTRCTPEWNRYYDRCFAVRQKLVQMTEYSIRCYNTRLAPKVPKYQRSMVGKGPRTVSSS